MFSAPTSSHTDTLEALSAPSHTGGGTTCVMQG